MATVNLCVRLRDLLIQMNMYNTNQSLSFHQQIFATRLYFGFILTATILLLALLISNTRTYSIIVISPSISQFETLSTLYPSTFFCRCTRTTVPFNNFISFKPKYHQICSSEFVSESWISSLFSSNMTYYFPLDFRTSASSQFQILALICHSVIQHVTNILEEFLEQQLINTHPLTRSAFSEQLIDIVEQLQKAITYNLSHMDQFVSSLIFQNKLVSALHTNYLIYSRPGSRTYTIYSSRYVPNNYLLSIDTNVSCDCELISNCVAQSGFYNHRINITHQNYFIQNPSIVHYVPGIMTGCIPKNSIFQSTLECFYNSSCLQMIQHFVGSNLSRSSLDYILESRFQANSTIESIFNELFLESWQNITNYTDYFHTCAPYSCSYTYVGKFDILSISVILFSLIGGLTMLSKFLILIVTEFIIDLHDSCISLINLWIYIKTKLLTMNLFSNSPITLTERQSIKSSRFYILSLVIVLLILCVYTSNIEEINSVTVLNPSLSEFDYIHENYPLKVSCPCSVISILYSNFMFIRTRFHEICTSDFVRDDRWLLYFNFEPLPNSSVPNNAYFSLDFRQASGRSLFRFLQTLCHLANETITNALTNFNQTRFVTLEPLSNENFIIQTSSLVQQFKEHTLRSFSNLLSFVRSSIEDNHLFVSLVSNYAQVSFTINGSWTLKYITTSYNQTNSKTCSCLTSNNCSRPQGFYCSQSSCHTSNVQPNRTIPGLVIGCFPMNSLFLSTFQCLYSRSCVQMLLNWRLFDTERWYKPIDFNISALDPHISSRFSRSTTVEQIASVLMIEQWINETNRTNYYDKCKPRNCTYSYKEKGKISQSIIFLISSAASSSLLLRLLIPFFMKRFTRQNHDQINIKACLTINIFNEQLNVPRQLTRIYCILLCGSFCIVLMLTGILGETKIYEINLPSKEMLNILNEKYKNHSLSCPCRQTSIPYGRFLSMTPIRHQLCLSDFISNDWWSLVASTGDSYFLKDRPLLSAYFRMLASLCQLTNQSIHNSVRLLNLRSLVNRETLSSDDFQNHINFVTNTFTKYTPRAFVHTQKFISETIRSNQFQNMFMTTWKIAFTTVTENYVVATESVSYNNETCTCTQLKSPKCARSLVVILKNTSVVPLPGLYVGCSILDGLRQSKIGCFFDSSCLYLFKMMVNDSTVPPFLNSSFATRFAPMTTTFGDIIDELFIEDWIIRSDYSSYFNSCSPYYCRYTLVTHNDLQYMMTKLLSLSASLAITIEFFVTRIYLIHQML